MPHAQTVLMAVFPGEPGLASCVLDFLLQVICSYAVCPLQTGEIISISSRRRRMLIKPHHSITDTMKSFNTWIIIIFSVCFCHFLVLWFAVYRSFGSFIYCSCVAHFSSVLCSTCPNHNNLPVLVTKVTGSAPGNLLISTLFFRIFSRRTMLSLLVLVPSNFKFMFRFETHVSLLYIKKECYSDVIER